MTRPAFSRVAGSLALVGACACDGPRVSQVRSPFGSPFTANRKVSGNLMGAAPVNRDRPRVLRGVARTGTITGTPFTPVLPPHVFACRTTNCITEGSRWLPAGARVSILETLELPHDFRNPLLPSSMMRGGGTIRIYRIRYQGPSLDPTWRHQYTDTVNGFIDATRVRV